MKTLLRNASFSVLAAAFSLSSMAQDGVSENDQENETARLDTVTVTSERREENIQSVPIAITAYDSEDLERRSISAVRDLQSSTPGLYYFEEAGQAYISIRGVGAEANTGVLSDPSVALSMDGVYMSRATAAKGAFFDLERVEVLRGPQGTLYGRNATGGSINIISKKPVLGEFSGEGDIAFGSDGFTEYRGVLNVPLGDKVALRVAAIDTEREPIGTNFFAPGKDDDIDDEDTTYLRGLLLFEPSDSTSLTLGAVYGTRTGRGAPQSQIVQQVFDPPLDTLVFGGVEPTVTEPRSVRLDTPGSLDEDGINLYATLNHSFDFAELTILGAYVHSDVDNKNDGDRTEVDFTRVETVYDNEQYSGEIRLTSNENYDFQWLVGASITTEDNQATSRFANNLPGFVLASFLPPLPPGSPPPMFPETVVQNNDILTPATSESVAIFADVTVPISERFRVTGGLRYSEDEKEIQVDVRSTVELPGAPPLSDFSTQRTDTYDAVTGRLIAEYDVTRDSLLYGSISRGYKAGGFSLDTNATPYEPEFVTSYEIGSKNTFLGGRLILNGAAFYYENEDFQVLTSQLVLNQNVLFIENSDAKTLGAEVQAAFILTPEIVLDASVSLLDSEYVGLVSADPSGAPTPTDNPLVFLPPAEQDLDGNRKTFSPPYTVSIGAQYMKDFAQFGSIVARLDLSFSDEVILRPFQKEPVDIQEAYSTIGANIVWRSPDEKYSVEVFGRNLTDEDIRTASQAVMQNNPVTWAPPQSFGIRAGAKF